MNVADLEYIHFGDTGINRQTQRGRNVCSVTQTDYALLANLMKMQIDCQKACITFLKPLRQSVRISGYQAEMVASLNIATVSFKYLFIVVTND